jgi:hypothetical protein
MASLYCILARDADIAIIFRRGPTKMVRLILWDLAMDTFEPGQWIEGRIYHEKADLTPDGKKLVYLAANCRARREIKSYIAVSTPPFATAHVLWASCGTWNDTSLFETNGTLALGMAGSDLSVEPKLNFVIPAQLQVKPKPWPGHSYKLAEHERLVRDGWAVYVGDPVYKGRVPAGAGLIEYRKPIGGQTTASLNLIHNEGNFTSYAILKEGCGIAPLRADWADVRGEDVLFSDGGKLFRLSSAGRLGRIIEIADFSAMKFEEITAPDWAKTW